MPASFQIHNPKFERNTATGEWRGWCLCGWYMRGTQAEVAAKAAVHDLDWVAADPVSPRVSTHHHTSRHGTSPHDTAQRPTEESVK